MGLRPKAIRRSSSARRASIGFFWPNLHVYVWRTNGCGMHVRRRIREGAKGYAHVWQHTAVRLHTPALKPLGRGTRTYELEEFLSTSTSGSRVATRVTLKRFLRLKIGFGGARA